MPSYSAYILRKLAALSLMTVSCLCHADFKKAAAAYQDKQYDVAIQELKPLAEAGDSNAQYLLGSIYQNGNGVEKDEKEAVAWYFKAARGGHNDAQLALADMYLSGKGTDKDATLAAYWQWRSAYTMMIQAQVQAAAEYKKMFEISSAPAEKQTQSDNSQKTIGRTEPVTKECGKAVYPREARRASQQGKVILFFIVGADGNVVDLSVMQSSGWPLLDKASIETFRSCKFSPATVDGTPVESVFAMSYTWHIRNAP